jgi:hypothetical protein
MVGYQFIRNIFPGKLVSTDPLHETEASNDIPPHYGFPYRSCMMEQRSGYFKVNFGIQRKVRASRGMPQTSSWGLLARVSVGTFAHWVLAGIKFLKV